MNADDYDPRGAIHRAAVERAAQRSLGGIAPPPRPKAPTSHPSSLATQPQVPDQVPPPSAAPPPVSSNPNQPLRAIPSPVPVPESSEGELRSEGTDGGLIGKQRGNLRYVRLYLSGTAAEAIEDIRRRSRQTRGVIVMDAVRSTYTEIRTAFAVDPDPDPGPFGAPRASRRRRYAVEHPTQVTISVTPDEAKGLQALSETTGLSVSAIVSEAVERALRNASELAVR